MKNVLIVDEDVFTRNVFAQTLSRRGFEVSHASSCAEALELFHEAVELVVVDGLLPDGDAVELIRALRGASDEVAIVFLSSVFREPGTSYDTLTEDLQVALVLHKPISPVEFCAQIENVFDISNDEGWFPDTADFSVIDEVEEARLAYRQTLGDKLLELERHLEEVRDRSEGVDESLAFLALLRGTASRYGFFEVARATGRIESALVRLVSLEIPNVRLVWTEVFDALDDAVVASRSLQPEKLDQVDVEASVLVIDDDPEFLERTENFGHEHLIRVVTASTPAEAIDKLRDPTLDALLVDVELRPGFDTFEFVRRLRERSLARRLALGFIAAHGKVPDRVIAAHLGASVFVEKPLDSSQFADVVHRLTADRTSERSVVVIVDDDLQFVAETTEILARAGMTPHHLDDSREVIDSLDTLTPDGLVINVSMPGIGGFDLCRMIRAIPRWHELPLLLVGDRMDAETRIAAFRAGADDYLSKPPLRDELLARLHVRMERLRLLREQASIDMLTGLLTRRAFMQRMTARLSEVRRSSRTLALGLIDLDHFKDVNDTYGHVAGDRVLAALGRLLAHRFRMEDVRGRWGGEEFVVALVDEDVATADKVLQRTLEEFSELVFVGDHGEKFSVTFSAGISVFPDDGHDFRELLQRADKRLYAAKAAGRNRVVSQDSG